MRNLVGVELVRFASRRSVRAFGVVALLGVLAAGTLTLVLSNRDLAGATRQARLAATREYQACLRGELDLHELPEGVQPTKGCLPPDLATITADPRFHLTALRDVLGGAAAMLVLIGLAVGASSVGAEWHHRTMTTALTWEARRVRLLGAKMTAAGVASAVGVLAVLTLLAVALVPAAAFRGTTAGADGRWLAAVVGVAIRGSLLAGMAAVVGAAIAAISRNTAIAIGISFGWLTAAENIVRGLRPGWAIWLFGENAASLVAPGSEGLRTALGGGLVLGVYVAALAAVAMLAFRRRDVA